MKTFDLKRLITWANRDLAVVGNKYYFGDTVNDIKKDLEQGLSPIVLNEIEGNSIASPFIYRAPDYTYYCHACILPEEAVIETESEKEYRPCKNLKEFYNLVREIDTIFEENTLIFNLLHNTILHIRRKDDKEGEVYSFITKIIKRNDTFVIGIGGGIVLAFDELFGTFEIEVKGKWQPFGVLEE